MLITDELKAQLGIEDQAQLEALLKAATEKGGSIKAIQDLAGAIAENTRVVAEREAKRIELETQELEAAKFEEMAKSKLHAVYGNLSDDDPEKAKIRAEIEKQLGRSEASTLLDADAVVKALQAPISRTNEKFEDTNDFRKAFDLAMLYCAAKEGIEKSKKNDEEIVVNFHVMKRAIEAFKKHHLPGVEKLEKAIDVAMDSETAGEGYEWVPAQILSRNLYQDVWLQLMVAGNFSRFAAAGPNLSVPIRTSRTRGYRATQAKLYSDYFAQKFRASSMGTDTVDFAAEKYGVLAFVSDELNDDSAVAILTELYDDLAYGAAEGIEDAVLNGTTSLTDLDNQGADGQKLWNNAADGGDGIHLNTGAVDARNLWDGIRKKALAGTAKAASSTFAASEVLGLRKLMGKYGVKPEDLMLVVSPETYINMLGFDEVKTVDQYGAGATIIKGELARLWNVPIVVSSQVRNDYDNLGYFTSGTVVGGSAGVQNETVVMLVHKRGYAFADRMSMKMESERQILSQQRAVVGSMRLDFQKMFPSTEETEGILYSVAV